MKKVILLFALSLPLLSIGQNQPKFTAEQRLNLQTKKLQLELDLTEDQVKAVRTTLEKHQPKERPSRNEMESLTSEQRYEKRMERMDHQIAIQNSMKSILTESQFEKWKKIHAKGHKSMQKEKGKRKLPNNTKT